jgi:site-specific DNA recombinase
MERPGLKKLLDDIAAKRVDAVVVYKVDRLTRSLADFAKRRRTSEVKGDIIQRGIRIVFF